MLKAKQALLQQKQADERRHEGSQMEEAMRRLNAKGVVPTKQAYGIGRSKGGSQHNDALKAFQNQGGVRQKRQAL
jgi:hypothetical protein